jgi:hypothetical protein
VNEYRNIFIAHLLIYSMFKVFSFGPEMVKKVREEMRAKQDVCSKSGRHLGYQGVMQWESQRSVRGGSGLSEYICGECGLNYRAERSPRAKLIDKHTGGPRDMVIRN